MAPTYGQGNGSHQPPSPPHTTRLSKRRRVSPQNVGEINTATLVESLNTTNIGGSYGETSGSGAPHQQQQQQAPTTTMAVSSSLHTQRTAPVNTYSSTIARHHTQPLKLTIGGYALEVARLNLPPGLGNAECNRRQVAMAHELVHQATNPPVLPPTQVEDLPPKPYLKEFHKISDNLSDRQRKRVEAINNEIAAEHQRVERERNNQAAKKSRQTRMEALNNTRKMLNEKSAECMWLRMKLISLGGSVEEWGIVPAAVKENIIKEIDQRVKLVDAQNAEIKKKEDAKKRAERVKRRAEMEDQLTHRQRLGEEEFVVAEGEEEESAIQVKVEEISWVVEDDRGAE